MSHYSTIEEAIENGSEFYFDDHLIESEGRSGGTRCPKCKVWAAPPRKRKHPQKTWLNDCEICEIKDPFRRMWHHFNRGCDEDERKLHNEWLREVRLLLGHLEFFPDGQSCKKMELYKLIHKIPFFEGN